MRKVCAELSLPGHRTGGPHTHLDQEQVHQMLRMHQQMSFQGIAVRTFHEEEGALRQSYLEEGMKEKVVGLAGFEPTTVRL